MPWLHRYVGNPVLTGVLNLFFRTGVSDAHCGMRALRRDVLPRLDLRTTGMEFASEMVIRASKEKLDIREFPIEYHPRGGECKLSSFRDGWRHLRFLLVHSPTHLFMLPGALHARARRARRRSIVAAADRRLRPRVGPAHDGRRRAADDRRRRRSSRSASARTPTARTSWARRTRGSTACARASGSSTACCSAARSLLVGPRRSRAVIVVNWIDRGFGAAVRGAPGGARRGARDRRHPDLLLVVPALHPRPAPPPLASASRSRSATVARGSARCSPRCGSRPSRRVGDRRLGLRRRIR